MQVAHRSHVLDMLDPDALRALLAAEHPHVVVPEIEAIATHVLAEAEAAGVRVVPTARATVVTMDREGIRRLAAEELGLPTSPYRFVDALDDLRAAVGELGFPCVVKPVMSSSGKGQSVVRTAEDVATAWAYAQTGGRVAGSVDGAPARVIVEGFVAFDSEITLLTVRHVGGTTFCDPVGHVQVDGDYRESWQPAVLAPATLAEAQHVAATVTDALGGWGVFGVELFVVGDRVLFSEVSPRPGWSLSSRRTSRSSRCTRAPCSGSPWATCCGSALGTGRVRRRRARCSPRAPEYPCSQASARRSRYRPRRCACSASRRSTGAAAWP
jgi:phosphoribosylglycinamide formyltransferase 2